MGVGFLFQKSGVNKPAGAMEAGGVNKPAGGVYKPTGPGVN